MGARIRATRDFAVIPAKRNGLTTIDSIAPAKISPYKSYEIRPFLKASPPRIKENSPICARPIATGRPTSLGRPNRRVMIADARPKTEPRPQAWPQPFAPWHLRRKGALAPPSAKASLHRLPLRIY